MPPTRPSVPTMNPPRPSPTRKETVRTAATSKQFTTWLWFSVGFIGFQVVAGTHPVHLVGGYLIGSAVAVMAARVR